MEEKGREAEKLLKLISAQQRAIIFRAIMMTFHAAYEQHAL